MRTWSICLNITKMQHKPTYKKKKVTSRTLDQQASNPRLKWSLQGEVLEWPLFFMKSNGNHEAFYRIQQYTLNMELDFESVTKKKSYKDMQSPSYILLIKLSTGESLWHQKTSIHLYPASGVYPCSLHNSLKTMHNIFDWQTCRLIQVNINSTMS